MIGQDELIGARIKALCELLGLSRVRLAEGVGMTPAQISKIESGSQRFTLEVAGRLAQQYCLPLGFFTQRDPLAETAVPTFRKKARASASEQKRSVRLAREATRVFAQVSAETGYRPFNFSDDPDLLDDVEQVAIEVRRAAGIGPEEPVANVTRVLERQGIGVINGLDPDGGRAGTVTGVSLPSHHNRRPLVALVSSAPGAIARFTLAHEAAHHIWDNDLASPMTSTRDYREQRAHRFAGALLLPQTVVSRCVTERTTLRGYLPIKADYGLSVGAIIMRARDTGAISAQRARSLQIQLSSLGWRDPAIEPVDVTSERPLLLQQALSRVTDLGGIALGSYTGLPPELVRHWMQLAPEPEDAPTADVIDLAARRRRGRTPVKEHAL
ncbi:XRE family transcriptional regulator [Actinomyces timonensis]|uniref:XRE family transcriptional regulator n=1 Tax=Actinomyces timonensis TaxID=1288391 RepID=A0AAU8N6J7_9ACTO